MAVAVDVQESNGILLNFARGDLFKMSNLVRIQLKMKTLVSLGLTAMVCQ